MGKILAFLILVSVLSCSLEAQTATITTTPGTLAFTYQSGSTTLPKAQSIAVKPSTGKPTFTTATPPTDFWLTVNTDSGTLPASISVEVNPTSLAVGSYNSSVTITVAGVGSPAVVTVTLEITSPPSTLTISPGTLLFTAPPTPSVAQTVTLSTNGSPISFTATSGVTWMTVSPAVGIVLPGELTTLTINVTAATLAPQAAPYAANITVVASGASVTVKSQNILVDMTVNSVTPTIASVWPPVLPENAGAQTITVRGTSFYSATLVVVQGVPAPLTTTVLSPSALLAVVPAALLTGGGVLNIVVENPAPGGSSVPVGVTVANVPTIFGVFNAASYATATVSPGELVTMFGSNIGPPIPATMSIIAGYVSTNLSNVTVTIDGQNAPILYVSSSQVTVQVPYESTLGAGKAVVVSNGTNPPAATTVAIAAEAPGIFTADGSGVGEAAAINTGATSGLVTLNSSTNPAKIGDTVSLYLTGEGNYNPVPLSGFTNTGYVIPLALSPLPQMSPLPTVKIGGIDASAGISYAGVVPGSIIGVLQINVVVPLGSATGATVPVVVTIGGISAQANVTLNIHP
ncbi:MAG: IPT/TIG domain-containing protein [Bryobacteraceae bacterium]